jgi:hypothetical protein
MNSTLISLYFSDIFIKFQIFHFYIFCDTPSTMTTEQGGGHQDPNPNVPIDRNDDIAYKQKVRDIQKNLMCIFQKNCLYILKYGNFELFDEITMNLFSDDDDDDEDNDELHQDINFLDNIYEAENHNEEEQTVSMSDDDDDDDDALDDENVQPIDVNVEPLLDTDNDLDQTCNIVEVKRNFNTYFLFSFFLIPLLANRRTNFITKIKSVIYFRS